MGLNFSVVIPCYNAERWIDETLQSIENQTVAAAEIILVDDGSTDRSVERIKNHPAVTHLLHTNHLGPAGARNAGIEVATGDWIAFLDADDWWKPNHLEAITTLVEGSTDVVYLAAAEHYSINVGRIVSMSDTGPFEQPTGQLDHQTYFDLYLKHGLLELSSMAIRRDRLQEVGGFLAEMRGAEDLELMLRVVHGHTWAYDPNPSSVYRCNNPESHSRKFAKDKLCLTAKLRTLIHHQQAYGIPDSMIQSMARTTMSKAIVDCDGPGRQYVSQLVQPYLSQSQRLVFALANYAPQVYEWMNGFRQWVKGPQYRPRKVVPPAS